MSMRRRLRSIVRFFRRRHELESEIEAELQFHLEQETALNVRRGMTEQEARRAALLSIGSLSGTVEECRDARAGRVIETTLQDIRYGFRILRNNPGFSAAAIVTLALGIGVNTAIFSVVYGVLLRPMPFKEGERLVVLHQKASRAGLDNIPFSTREVFDYRDQSRTLRDVVEHHSMTFLLLGDNTADRVQTAVVSPNFFDVLGVTPLFGRTFLESDDAPGAGGVLILGHKYWKEVHGGDPGIVGKSFRMNNRPHTVIGVLPPIPQYPVESDVYMPTSHCPTRSSEAFRQNRQARLMTVFGRLREGVALPSAQADLSTIAGRLESAYPEAYPEGYGYGITVASLRDDLTRRAQPTFVVLLGASGLVLLIACANVANLLLARLLKLQRELAVRTALGATRLRLARQLLTESMLLSLAGGALGLALAPLTLTLLVNFASRFTTRAAEVKIDAPVLVFTLLVSLATGVLFGLGPVLSTARHFGDSLRQASARDTASAEGQAFRAALTVAQVAVAFILLIAAGLALRSFARLQRVSPGFHTDRLLTMRLTPDNTRYRGPEALRGLWSRILERTQAVGGVEAAALASNYPFSPAGIASGPGAAEFEIEGRPVSKGELQPLVDLTVVSAGYFAAIRQPLIGGRYLSDQDGAAALPAAVINQTMARHRWPSEDPIGKRVRLGREDRWITIVGVVGDVKEYGLHRPMSDEMYLPLSQSSFAGNLVARTALDPAAVAPLVRAALREVDPQLAVDQVNTVERLAEESFTPARVTTWLLGLFAALSLVMTAGGVAGVMALSVTQRTRELGIRMALGASRPSIVRMVVGQGVRLTLAGTAAGTIGALVLARLLSPLLYETSPTDVVTFVAVLALFLCVSVAACLLPAWQVTSIDPLAALRQE
jgi:predicted permease